MSPMRYFIDAAVLHAFSTDHGSHVIVDDTSDVPVSLPPSSDHSVCNSQKENTEECDAEYVVADDSDITDDYSSSSETEKVLFKKNISLFCTCKTPWLV